MCVCGGGGGCPSIHTPPFTRGVPARVFSKWGQKKEEEKEEEPSRDVTPSLPPMWNLHFLWVLTEWACACAHYSYWAVHQTRVWRTHLEPRSDPETRRWSRNHFAILNIKQLELEKSGRGRLWGKVCTCVSGARARARVYVCVFFPPPLTKAARFNWFLLASAKAAAFSCFKLKKWRRKEKTEEREWERERMRLQQKKRYKLLFHCVLLLGRVHEADGTVRKQHVEAVVQRGHTWKDTIHVTQYSRTLGQETNQCVRLLGFGGNHTGVYGACCVHAC